MLFIYIQPLQPGNNVQITVTISPNEGYTITVPHDGKITLVRSGGDGTTSKAKVPQPDNDEIIISPN